MSGPHPLRRPQGQLAGPLISGAMVYSKSALTVGQQLAQLRKRGLTIADPLLAKHFLENVSYYRLAGYWWTLQSDQKRHRFRRGATFQQVIDRYNFDRELRLIILDMIERLEIGLRTKMIYHFSLSYGTHWFEDVNLIQNPADWAYNLKRIKKETKKSNEVYLRKYFKKYVTDTRNPPCWMSLEIVSLGTLSKMFENLKARLPEKDLIAKEFGLPDQTFLENWIHGIAVTRNIAAHHSRLFQRTLPIKPVLPKALPGKWIDTTSIDKRSVYFQASSMAYLLQSISPNNRFALRLEELFQKYRATVKFKEVGFPANWKTQPLWK